MQLSFLDPKDGTRRHFIYLYLFIFILTFVLGLVGTYARISAVGLSIFWPVNAVDAVLFYRLDGAFSEVADEATAFGGSRAPGYNFFTIAVCPNQEVLDADRAWVRGMNDALRPLNVEVGETPLTPRRVIAALQAQGAGRIG